MCGKQFAEADFQIWIKFSPPTAKIHDGLMKDGTAKAVPMGQGRILSATCLCADAKAENSPVSFVLTGLFL